MKVLFDTSVIVAASLPKHPNHSSCFIQLQAAKSGQIEAYISTHTLAEAYSVLTRMPSQPRMSPSDAKALLSAHLSYIQAISLELRDYQAAMDQMAALNLPGGGIFDALIAQAALKAAVDRILTLNLKHFTRLSSTIAQIVQAP
ncbi:type II toxin-antitoxin system VapC family toxin [Leptolyngbya sp. NIES-2104]|uniref:type II toxin-antitoxin system VapC family toxin n=1 Tax=Leptolyngbya sp. NIES-2104 TaxID=1552121 RepID=UPI0006EC65B2|nr:PIN domain-containing protein [Leptolyngbya sp. NIES-2104]GAP95472.1 toxin 1, PIN domain [Leptolyngbya sp. NIES-2104]